MSSKHADNIVNLITQMRTAMSTAVKDGKSHHTYYPQCVLLVASGIINKHAQEHIVDEIKDPRLTFRDADDLIPEIDKHMPEYWLGIDVKRLPYLKNFRDHLLNQSDTIDMTQIGVSASVASPITDDTFVQLLLHRYAEKVVKSHGKTESNLDVEEFNVQELLAKRYKLILITGDAGAGKTTLLRRIAMLLTARALQTADDRIVPVYLRSIDVSRSNETLVGLAADATKRISGEGHAFERTDLVEGAVTLLLDGYDEIGTPELRETFAAKIVAFHQEFPLCHIYLTSRDSPHLKDLSLPFTKLRVSPINISQANKIIERISKGKELPTHTTEEIIRQLDNVHGIDLSPLLVTVFVATTDFARSDIPANITELFKKFTEMMLGRWDQSKGVAQQYQANVKEFLLRRIAFEMHRNNQTTINVTDFKRAISEILTERNLSADEVILYDEIVNRSNLVRIVDNELSFRHFLLQEFFAGCGIPSAEFLRSVLGKHWWMRAIIFYFGSKPDDEIALSSLPSQLDAMEGTDLYQAAVTVGLAIQACYLTRTAVKLDSMEWVVHSMANAYEEVIEWFGTTTPNSDTLRSVFYYVYGRDGIAAKDIDLLTDRVFADTAKRSEEITPYQERVQFWCLAGLIGSGNAEKAEEHLKHFNPSNVKLLLCLLMAAVFLEKVKVADGKQKKAARRIIDRIRPLTAHLTRDVLKEMKGLLLEVRSSQMTTLDSSRSDEDLESEYIHGTANPNN